MNDVPPVNPDRWEPYLEPFSGLLQLEGPHVDHADLGLQGGVARVPADRRIELLQGGRVVPAGFQNPAEGEIGFPPIGILLDGEAGFLLRPPGTPVSCRA